jgi:adenylate cyclase
VLRHQGTLDKYLGDGFMATFGSFREESDAAARAIACAFELHAEIERWNVKRGARQAERLAIAVGVHFGPVVVGNLGSEERLEFTVVGDVVNVASRLEEATRELGCMIAISGACVQAAGPAHRHEGFEKAVEVRLRGRESPLLVHVAGCVDVPGSHRATNTA